MEVNRQMFRWNDKFESGRAMSGRAMDEEAPQEAVDSAISDLASASGSDRIRPFLASSSSDAMCDFKEIEVIFATLCHAMRQSSDNPDGVSPMEIDASSSSSSSSPFSSPTSTSHMASTDPYVQALSELQVQTVDSFSNHKFSSMTTGTPGKDRNKRLISEFTSMQDSLPLDKHGAIFLRWSESQMQLMKALIVAPSDTPYGGGAFVFDIRIPDDYPASPPKCEIVTTGGGVHRFNPNLYANGKVCLSLLGTWAGEPWDSRTSTLHQVLMSIYGLIFVEDPYFNEPGYQATMGTLNGTVQSTAYNVQQKNKTVELAMLNQLKTPPAGFEEVVKRHFYYRQDDILDRIGGWAEGLGSNAAAKGAAMKLNIAKFKKLIKKPT